MPSEMVAVMWPLLELTSLEVLNDEEERVGCKLW